MTRRFTSEIINEIGPEKDIPAPDVGTDASVMAWIFDTYSMNKGHSVLGVVTGKPLEHRRLARAARGDRARGALLHARGAAGSRRRRSPGLRVAVQGFGNVGSFLAQFLAEQGAKVIAVSDSTGGVYNPNGHRRRDRDRAQAGDRHRWPASAAPSRSRTRSCCSLDCDVLAPCALEQVITADNADKVKAKIICEGANGPTTPAADEILEERGVLVLPDVLANAGGVVVSYFEWVQGLQEYFWKEDEVNARLNDIMHARVQRDLEHDASSKGTSMRRPPTGSPSSASPRRRRRAACTRSPRSSFYHAARAAISASARGRQLVELAGRARLRARGGRHPGDAGAGGALPRAGCPSSRSTASGPSRTSCRPMRSAERLVASVVGGGAGTLRLPDVVIRP